MWSRRTEESGRKSSKGKSRERCGTHLTVQLIWCFLTFLSCLPCAASLTIQGQKGGSITFPCLSTKNTVSIRLTYGSKIAYGGRPDKEFKGRVQKSGTCNLILQGLKSSEAGNYIMQLHDKSGYISTSYDVHVSYNISGHKDKQLMFDELPRQAHRVEFYSGEGWTEMWKRGQDVNRLTEKNGFLSISTFTSSDAGAYRVLNETGGILVTVIVTETCSEEISLKEDQKTSCSSKTTVYWSAGLSLLIHLFFGYL